jgi:hypothetical protein
MITEADILAAREMLDTAPVPKRTNKELQAIALAYGAWACPRCADGWEQYLIHSDMHICAVCGYKGGPV